MGMKISPVAAYPRARGGIFARVVPSLAGEGRCIPARAGESVLVRCVHGGWATYPRACGGILVMGYGDRSGHNLSPRVRGNRSSLPP